LPFASLAYKIQANIREDGKVRWIRLLLRYVLGPIVLGAVTIAGLAIALRWWTDHRYRQSIYTVETVPSRRVAIVFGAGVWPDGRLSDVLADRVATAVELYRRGKVEKLLMTGDNRHVNYNEPQHMYEYAVSLGVPPQDIVRDYAGRRTYDSCYRARHIFGVQDAILITQQYHMDRALFIAQSLGLDAVGVLADRRPYLRIRDYWYRELLATVLAWWEVKVTHPVPVLGQPEPISKEAR